MATLVEGGLGAFNALVYGELHPNAQNFIRSQFENSSALLNDAGKNFFDRTAQIVEEISNNTALRVGRAVKRSLGSIWDSDEIRQLVTIEQMQWAKPKMQRWIMCNPEIKQLYQEQKIEGYYGTYKDPFAEDIGEADYNYRRVMNGIVVDTEDEGWSATTWYDDLLPDDRELHLEEQNDILISWTNIVAKIREGGDDPTSRFNASL